jgi:hypothetical protein
MIRDPRIEVQLVRQVEAAAPFVSFIFDLDQPKETWSIEFKPEATPEQRAAAQAVIDGFDANAVQAAIEARLAELQSDSAVNTLIQRLREHPAQIDDWLAANVTNLAQARAVLGALIKYIALRMI